MNSTDNKQEPLYRWQDFTADNMPEPKTLVWIERTNGKVYLGHRTNKPHTINTDLSRDCFWYGSLKEELSESVLSFTFEVAFKYNFSDATVVKWRPFSWLEQVEQSPSQQQSLWRTGFTIINHNTAKWTKAQIDKNNETENRMVFENFDVSDMGRSRRLICTCETKEQASDVVEKYNAAIQAYKSPSTPVKDGWVRVNDGLPEINKHVLTYHSTWDNIASNYIDKIVNNVPVWANKVNGISTDVTHWQPLPQPPKSDN